MKSLLKKYPKIINTDILSSFKLTDEQDKYICDNIKYDTSLIACAGAGKTKCILEKIKFLVNNGLMTNKQFYIFSYSKFTIEHYKELLKRE